MDRSSWPAPGPGRREAERLAGEQAAPPRELRAIAEEQAALRRVAMLVAGGAAPGTVFAGVAEEVGQVLPEADFAMVARYDADGGVEVVGGWSRAGSHQLVGRRSPLGGRNVSTLVFETGRAARVDHLDAGGDAVSASAHEIGMRSSAGAPISVEGRLWGAMIVTSVRENALPSATEQRLAAFTELIATTIANTQARQELRVIAEEQAALRRVATLVAHGEPPLAVFEAVAREVGRLLPADFTLIGRYEGGLATGVAGWSSAGAPVPVREQVSLSGRSVTGTVFRTGRPARMDSYAGAAGGPAEYARDQGISSSVGAPIIVEGRLWGVIVAAAVNQQPLPPDTEDRLAGFTELAATALANAEARQELRRVAEEQAALRRVATLVAQGASSPALFHAVTEETGLLLPADATVLMRYDADGFVTRVGRWSRPGIDLPPGDRSPLGGRNVTTLVFEAGRAARLDNYGDDAGDAAAWVAAGLSSSVGVPISVEGRLWGVVVALSMSAQALPADADARLAGFTELVATAIANADAQAELTASRARIVATADETRRRIERDLHDGAQQRLVTLGLQLRSVQADMPPELGELRTSLDRVAAGLTSALDELREYARGIHPAILTEGGLGAALRVLARRSPVPVTLDVRAGERLPELLEVTAYYVISEALVNAAKHAGASAVHIGIEQTAEVMRLSIRDDGTGGADPLRGSGLVGLKDRVAAVGGTLNVQSRPGEGTILLAELPVSPARLSPASRPSGFADLADASLPGPDPAAVRGGVAEPGHRLARGRVDEDRVRLTGSEGVLLSPLAQADDEVEEVLALLGEHVLLVGAAARGVLDAQDAGLHEVTQPHGEDVPGDAEIALELVEPPDAVEGVADDQQRPFVAQDVDGAGHRACRAGRLRIHDEPPLREVTGQTGCKLKPAIGKVVSVYYHLAGWGLRVERRLSMLLAVACGVSVANVYYAQPLLGRIGAGLHVGAAQLGLVTTVTQAGYLLGLILIVPLGDLADRRRLIVVQGLAAAAGLVTAGFATDTAVFFAASAVVGLVCVVVQVIVAYAAAMSVPGRRGAVVGTVTSGVVIGILLARTASGLIAELLGWRAVYFMAAGLMLALALALGRLLPPDNAPKQPASYPALIGSAVTLTARDRTFRVRSLIALLMFGGFGAVWGSIALPLAAAPWHLSPGEIGLFGIVGVAGALGASRAGRLADRGRAQRVTGACLALLIVSWAATRAAPYSLPLLAVGLLVLDFAGQALHVTSEQLIVAANPAASSRIIGSYMTFYSVGTGGGAIAATILYSLAGWGAVSALGAGLSVMALLVWAADRLRPDNKTGTPSSSKGVIRDHALP